MKPTLHDVARQTGFSVATVSRALHRSDSPNVSAETRRHVSEVARRIGYHPNLAGRILSTGRSHTISYWTYNAFAPYYAMVAERISYEANQRGYVVIMNSSYDPVRVLSPDSHRLQASPALNSGFDGLIACDVAYQENEFAAQLRSLRVPFVGIGLNYPTSGDYVGLDLYAGAQAAILHLIDSGCRRIAMLCESRAQRVNDPRALAYVATLDAAGFAPLWLISNGDSRGAARAAAAGITASPDMPDAILCLNDQLAVGCYRGLRDAGIRVPDDIMLVGCDGTEEAAYQACPITSIVPPVADMCRLAWDCLEARVADPDAEPNQTILAPTLVIRSSSGSTACPSSNNTNEP